MERIIIKGVVQGVGFRPFLSRLAKKLGLSGIIKKTQSGVEIIASGNEDCLNQFKKSHFGRKATECLYSGNLRRRNFA